MPLGPTPQQPPSHSTRGSSALAGASARTSTPVSASLAMTLGS